MAASLDLSDLASRIVSDHVQQVRRAHHVFTLQDFAAQPTDVFVGSWMKSGTTFMQQLLYQLFCATDRVPSDPAGQKFDDIGEVIPFVNVRHASGVRESRNPYKPRAWKTHSTADELSFDSPATGRFIYCVRDGLQVAPSYFDFALDWLAEEPIEGAELRAEVYREFFEKHFLGLEQQPDGSYTPFSYPLYDWFGHVKGWLDAKRDHILFVTYEEATQDIPTTVREIAKFLNVEVNEEIVKRVASRCDRRVMAPDKRFNDTLISKLFGWKKDGGVRVRLGNAPGFKQMKLPLELLQQYDVKFSKTFGVQNYSDLVRIMQERNKSYFGT